MFEVTEIELHRKKDLSRGKKRTVAVEIVYSGSIKRIYV